MSVSSKKIFCLLIIIFTLSACKQEPMIKLSKENQIKIEKKQAQEEQDEVDEDTNKEHSKSADQITFDSKSWVKEAEDVTYNLQDFLPYKANQVKTYSNGIISYVDYIDQTTQQMQVRKINNNENDIIELYRWNTENIQQYGQIPVGKAHTNYLLTPLKTNQLEESHTLLQSPIKEGTKWTSDNRMQSEIVGLYRELSLEGHDYQKVVEVIIQMEEGEKHQLIAADKGIIAEWQKGTDEQSLAKSITDNVMLVTKEEVYMPRSSTETPFIQKENVDFAWQTNDTLVSAFQRFFYDNAWISPAIQVIDIYENNGIAHLNFSSGVVATMNQHPAGEKAVAIAMMVNLANYYSVNQVRLEVFTNGMLLNSIPYPPNGVHEIDPAWLGQDTSNDNVTTVNDKPIPDREKLIIE